MLTGEQLYEIANVYNTGVAMGFAQAFAAMSNWYDMDVAYGQARDYWPGGPVAKGALGAAITRDGKPLQPFLWNPAPQPRTFPGTYYFMRDNERNLIATLLARTPYAHYASFGAQIAILEVNARSAMDTGSDIPWQNAKKTLDMLVPFANDICRPGEHDWRTPLNVAGLRDLRAEMASFSGPTEVIMDGVGKVAAYVYQRVIALRHELGNTIAQFAESGVPGEGCLWPKG